MEDIISITELTEEYNPKEEDYMVIENEIDGTRRIPLSTFNPKAVIKIKEIIATYTQTSEVYPNTPLDSLRANLVVTEKYSDGSTKTITSYSLSGTLEVGTSAVTVLYRNFTTTFNVVVSAEPAPPIPSQYLYEWDFTESLVDKAQGHTATLTNLTRTNEGVTHTYERQSTAYITLFDSYAISGKTIEVDYTLLMTSDNTPYFAGELMYSWHIYNFFGRKRNSNEWIVSRYDEGVPEEQPYSYTSNRQYFYDDTYTFKFIFEGPSHLTVMVNDELFYDGYSFIENDEERLCIGHQLLDIGSWAITGVRIYNTTQPHYWAEWDFVNARSNTALTDKIYGHILDKRNAYSSITIDGNSYCNLDDYMRYLKFPSDLIFDFDAEYTSLEYVINIKKFYGVYEQTTQGRVFAFSDNWGNTPEHRLTLNYGFGGEYWRFVDDIHNTDVSVAAGKGFFDDASLRIILSKTSETTMKFLFYKDNTFLAESSEISKTDFTPYRNALSLSSWQNLTIMALSGIQVIAHYDDGQGGD